MQVDTYLVRGREKWYGLGAGRNGTGSGTQGKRICGTSESRVWASRMIGL